MKITVVGAGNIGLAMTGYMIIHHKAEVTLFTTKRIASFHLNMLEQRSLEQADGFSVTMDPETAFASADIVFVTYPAFLRQNFIEKYERYFRKGTAIGFVPGYGGIEYSCLGLISHDVTVFGLQRVPYVARTYQENDTLTASILSSKRELYLGAIPCEKTPEIAEKIEELLDIPVKCLKEYLSITLAPSNPLLHTTGLFSVFGNLKEGQYFETPLRFYEQWNDNTSGMLFRYDAELQEICRRLTPLNMQEVVPLPTYYESPKPEDLTRKLKSIDSFKAVMVPLKKTEEGWIPDLSNRMFKEDFPFGVCIIRDFARMTGVYTPTIDLLLDFYARLSGHRYFNVDGTYTAEISETGIPGIHGLRTKSDVIGFYHR